MADRFQVGQHVAGEYAVGANALTRQPSVAPGVVHRSIATIMRLAIDFDAEPGSVAVEIQDVGAGRVLTAKA